MRKRIGFEGRVAVVTGAGGGLGREHALLLASRGAQVVVNDLGGLVDGTGASSGPAADVVREIEGQGGVAVPDASDIATPEGGEALTRTAIDAFGRIDIVVNNAGILRDKTFVNMDPSLWDPVIKVHLTGAMYVTRPAWVHMREQGYGRVINTASGSGLFGNYGQANYGAAKMGLVGLTKVLAQEGARYNINVNAIAPVARTRMTDALFDGFGDMLDARLVSPVVAYLASEDCSVSGEIYSVVGGRVARVFVGVTSGYLNRELTVEDVREHLAEIHAEDGYSVPPRHPTAVSRQAASCSRWLQAVCSS
jgi:NAD(P)-dependent dehydrogenase (short-subunit alcohol dehydrogenase family)